MTIRDYLPTLVSAAASIGLLLLNTVVRGDRRVTRTLASHASIVGGLQGDTETEYRKELDRYAQLAIGYSRFPTFLSTDVIVLFLFVSLPAWFTFANVYDLRNAAPDSDPTTAIVGIGAIDLWSIMIWLAFFRGWVRRAHRRIDFLCANVDRNSDLLADHLLTTKITLILLKGLSFVVMATPCVTGIMASAHRKDPTASQATNLILLGFPLMLTVAILATFAMLLHTKELSGKLPRLRAIMFVPPLGDSHHDRGNTHNLGESDTQLAPHRASTPNA